MFPFGFSCFVQILAYLEIRVFTVYNKNKKNKSAMERIILFMINYSWLPKVDKLIFAVSQVDDSIPFNWVTEAARQVLQEYRGRIATGAEEFSSEEALFDVIAKETVARCYALMRPSLRRVINATGIVLHTNLGRAVLAEDAVQAVYDTAQGYCNLEMDLKSGKRSSRYDHVSSLLSELCLAEDAMVVNNNAGAVLLVLDTFARGKEAIVSRGQLVEIGGSFRVPDIMERTGVHLKEVGATNKTHLSDYEKAINENTAMLMLVHTSNFKVFGFTEEVALPDLVALGRRYHIPVMDDLGSGCLYPLAEHGVGEEPLVSYLMKTGVDLLTFSGDKLLGGPQAGVIVGRKEFIDQLKKNPLTRALRVDKFTLAALEATLRIYKEGRAATDIPTLSMIQADESLLKEKAEQLRAALLAQPRATEKYDVAIERANAAVGGGSLPAVELPSYVVKVIPKHGKSAELLSALRDGTPAVVGYIREDVAVFDTRTVAMKEIPELAELIGNACAEA